MVIILFMIDLLIQIMIMFLFIFVPLSPNSVGEGIMFLGCPLATFIHLFVRPSVCSFVQTDLVTTIPPEWLEQSR